MLLTLEFLGSNAKGIQSKQKINNDLKQIIQKVFEGCNSINIITNTNKFFSEHPLDIDKLKRDAISIVELIDSQKYIVFSKRYFFVYRYNERSELRSYNTGRCTEFEDRENIINFRKPSIKDWAKIPFSNDSDNINKLEANPDIIKRIWRLSSEIVQYRDVNKSI